MKVKFKCSLAWLAGVVSACKQDLELSPVQLASLNEPFTSSKEVRLAQYYPCGAPEFKPLPTSGEARGCEAPY